MKRQKRTGDNKVKYGTISLPMSLIHMIKKRIKGTGMPSVSAYVAFVLRQVLSSEDSESKLLGKKTEKDIQKRLKSLGYA